MGNDSQEIVDDLCILMAYHHLPVGQSVRTLRCSGKTALFSIKFESTYTPKQRSRCMQQLHTESFDTVGRQIFISSSSLTGAAYQAL